MGYGAVYAPSTFTLTITDQSERLSTAESITTTETPPADSFNQYFYFGESMPATIAILETSVDGGTTFTDEASNIQAGFGWILGGTTSAGPLPMGANGRIRMTNPGTVGTYIVKISGASIA